MPKQQNAQDGDERTGLAVSSLGWPNGDRADFNRLNAGNLSAAEWMGKDKRLRQLYCKTCGSRFSECRRSLMQDPKLPTAAVVRIVKCLAHGCSAEATADICEVDPRSVQCLLERAGQRAAVRGCPIWLEIQYLRPG